MKVVLLLLLLCLVEADDLYRNVHALEDRVIILEGQLKTSLAGQADSASRLSATEAKTEELQSRLTESEKLVELQRIKADQQQTSFDQLQDRLNLLTEEQDCRKRKLCEQDGFTFADGLCYYISTEQKNWDDSRQWCRDRNSDLIVIKSKEKQDLVVSFNKRVWLGLTDRETEGSFQWVDGTPLTTPTYWIPGEPVSNRDKDAEDNAVQDCVEYYDGSQSDAPSRGWNDATCSSHVAYWMCERVLC